MVWKPIETAPKETNILVSFAGEKNSTSESYFKNDYWYCLDGANGWITEFLKTPSHWMPLPESPQTDTHQLPATTVCPYCQGDGKETCLNPDHGFIDAMSFHEIGRLGCMVCGHDERHKVPGGWNCELCHGFGRVSWAVAEKFCIEMNYKFDDVVDWLEEPHIIELYKARRNITTEQQIAVGKMFSCRRFQPF